MKDPHQISSLDNWIHVDTLNPADRKKREEDEML